jgi:hypothetical protein
MKQQDKEEMDDAGAAACWSCALSSCGVPMQMQVSLMIRMLFQQTEFVHMWSIIMSGASGRLPYADANGKSCEGLACKSKDRSRA